MTPRKKIGLAAAVALLAAAGLGAPTLRAQELDGTEVIDGLEIHQLQSEIKEGNEAHWVVRLDKRPLAVGMEGYRPSDTAFDREPQPTTWEPPVEFFWSFGDSTGWISTGERPSVTHRYMEAAHYRLEVEARSEAGTVAGELQVEVLDRDYFNPLIRAIEVDPGTSTYELTADVFNPSLDEQTIRWDFGDGGSDEGVDLWRVRRAFPPGASREVTVTWTGDDGTEARKTRDLGGEPRTAGDELDRFDGQVVAEGVRTRFEGSFAGGLPASELRAEVRPFATLFLGATGDGACRFMLTAWDPELLARVHLLVDLPQLSPDRGRYRVSAPRFTLFADESSEAYLHEYRQSGLNERLGSLLGAIDFGGVTQGQVNRRLRGTEAGVQIGPREEQQIDGGAVVDASSLVTESEWYAAVGGAIEIALTPYQRAVGLVDLSLEGGTFEDRKACRGNRYAEGTCKTLQFDGRFALDLRAAPRDGVVQYEGCLDSDFAIRGVYGPEPGERHVLTRRPRVGVSFTSDVDPETLDASSFQLTYPDREGRPVPLDVRILRDDDDATIKPVEELWAGVRYTARVRTGEDGVRGLNGGALVDEDGTGWKEVLDFWTRLDFVPDEGSGEGLSCHVYQAVRDAPLVVGKPAVARIDADWRENPHVHEDAQLATLPARVVLQQWSTDGMTEPAGVEHEFVRPEAGSTGAESGLGGDTALLPFTPDRSTPATLGVTLEVDRGTETNRWWPYYRTVCSTPVWKHEPLLRLAFYAIDLFDDPTDEDVYARVLRYEEPLGLDYVAIKHLLPVKQEVAWSVVSFERIWQQEEYRDLLEKPWDYPKWNEEERAQWSALVAAAWSALREKHAAEGDQLGLEADLVIGLVPDFAPIEYSSGTPLPFDEEHPGTFMMFVGPTDRGDTLARAARTLLHMVGHFLGLEDTPPAGDRKRPLFVDVPFEVHPWVMEPEWHDGVEMSQRIEDEWHFFSSADTDPLVPLMSSQEALEPGYMLRHHYLAVQEAIEENPELLRP